MSSNLNFILSILKNPVHPVHYLRRVAFVLMALGATGGVVIAHACLSGQFKSVHFNSGMPDFGTVPRRGVIAWRGELSDRPVTTETAEGEPPQTELEDANDPEEEENRPKALAKHFATARELERSQKWIEAKREYETIAQQGWTGTLKDRVEIMTRLTERKEERTQAFIENLKSYFETVTFEKSAKPQEAVAVLDKIAADSSADWLRERAAYQAACLLAEAGETMQAIERYQKILTDYPKGAKRQETLIMLARTALLPREEAKRNLMAGEAALTQIEKEFPQTRYKDSIPGLKARLLFLRNQNEAAAKAYLALGDLASVEETRKKLTGHEQAGLDALLLAGYLEKMANTHSFSEFEQAIYNSDRTRAHMTGASSQEFGAILQKDFDVAAAYIYYRLYHTRNKPEDLKSLTQLADTLAEKHPGDKLPPLVRVRLAEIYYQRKMYPKALNWATQGDTPQTQDRALYVRAASRQKLGQNAAAMTDFNALLTRCLNSSLRRAARENLAILEELAEDRAAALDQYFALDYKSDIAFLLDVRMTRREIEAYLNTRPKNPQRDLIAYALGIRCLRDAHWTEAETWLKRVTSAKYVEYSKMRAEGDGFFDKASPNPLTAVRDLRRLYRTYADAKSDEARAKSLYACASYYSTHGTLLLYNPALWEGGRAVNFQMFWNTKQATPQDTAAVRDHMMAHEVYSRSRRICLDLAQRYPKSPVASAALYRAACCARRLAKFNAWWNEENHHHNYWNEATELMNRVAKDYPKSPQAAKARKYAKVFQQEKKDYWQ